MIRLALASVLAFAAAPVRAQGSAPAKDSVYDDVASFRSTQESFLGQGDLLALAIGEFHHQHDLGYSGEADAPEVTDVAAAASKTFYEIVAAYNNKLRSVIIGKLHPGFRVDVGAFDDDLKQSFRTYSVINLDAVIDNIQVNGDDATVVFHYNLSETLNSGLQSQYSGHGTDRFRMKDGRALLIQQDAPRIFATTLSVAENPQAVTNGPSVDVVRGRSPADPKAAPGCPAFLSGSGVGIRTAGTQGFFFATQTVKGKGQSDFFNNGKVGAAISGDLGLVKDIGAGVLLSAIHTFPSSGLVAGSIPVVVGGNYAVLTGGGNAALIHITLINVALDIKFDWEYQPTGATCF